jgi:hypothetical protein
MSALPVRIVGVNGYGHRNRRPVGVNCPFAMRFVAQGYLGRKRAFGSIIATMEIRNDANQTHRQHVLVFGERTEHTLGADNVPELGNREQFSCFCLPTLVDFAYSEGQEEKQQAGS